LVINLIKFKDLVKKYKFFVLAFLFLILGFFLIYISLFFLKSPLDTQKELIIDKGKNLSEVAEILEKEGIIKNKFVFIIYTILTGNEKKLQAGKYIFKPGITIPSIVYLISNGFAEMDYVRVIIPEGFNVFDIDNQLTLAGLIQKGEFAVKYYTDEGKFFPDTYYFRKEGENVDTIAKKMKDNFNLKLKNLLLTLGDYEFNNIIIKASILEEEAKQVNDMRLIAGVIENRLKLGMLLQVDATVAYGACYRQIMNLKSENILNQTYKYCDVSKVPIGTEIKVDGPYNTYTRMGFPPGPISNPGMVAIQAALNPISSDYIYYLSTRDGSLIIFSKTAEEHNVNRKKYLGL
jgi:UPF0755 protein